MSRKPLKHSEQRKISAAAKMKTSWGKPRSGPFIRMRPEHYLIVSEGTGTEPAYFGEMRRRVNGLFHGEYVTVEVQGLGMNTLSLLERAQEIAEREGRYTQVWVVYDKDSFPAADFNAAVDRCASLSGDGVQYRAAWTNEAFELWFILHFEFLQSALGRESYGRKLTEHLLAQGLGKYRKNRTDMYNMLEPFQQTAIANAERLEKLNEGKSPAECNPGTSVHKLVGELLSYTKPGKVADE